MADAKILWFHTWPATFPKTYLIINTSMSGSNSFLEKSLSLGNLQTGLVTGLGNTHGMLEQQQTVGTRNPLQGSCKDSIFI